MEQDPKTLKWTAPEYIHYPKSLAWFVVLTTISLGIIIYFLLAKDILTAVLFGLFYIIVFYYSKTKPKNLEIEISAHNLKLGRAEIPFQKIKSFWIIYNPPTVKTLNFETTAYLNRFISIQLQDQNPVEVRAFLEKYLPEDLDRGEHFSDKLSRAIKF